MSVWDEYNKKTYIDFIVSKYCHLFLMIKEKFCKFLNDFSLTQLKYYLKQQQEREVKNLFKELPFYGTLIEISRSSL